MSRHKKSDLLKAVKEGRGTLVEKVVQGVDLGDGNVLWLQDHHEEAMDGFIGVYDKDGMMEAKKVERGFSRGFLRQIRQARTVASAALMISSLPAVKELLKKKGVDPKKVDEVLKVASQGTREQKVRLLARELVNGLASERLQEVFEAVEDAARDGSISAEEWAHILSVAGV